jgi:hypothetical protein
MPTGGRGGGQPNTGAGHKSGERGGNRGGEHKPQKSGSGPRNGQQSHGADPHRGQPG